MLASKNVRADASKKSLRLSSFPLAHTGAGKSGFQRVQILGAGLAVRPLEIPKFGGGCSFSLRRNDSFAFWERGRLDRYFRRLAENLLVPADSLKGALSSRMVGRRDAGQMRPGRSRSQS